MSKINIKIELTDYKYQGESIKLNAYIAKNFQNKKCVSEPNFKPAENLVSFQNLYSQYTARNTGKQLL